MLSEECHWLADTTTLRYVGARVSKPVGPWAWAKRWADPLFFSIKSAFMPSFGVVVHVLLKRSRWDAGMNLGNRTQKFLYTEKETRVFEEAWHMTQGLRESLLLKPGTAVAERSVLEMLQGSA